MIPGLQINCCGKVPEMNSEFLPINHLSRMSECSSFCLKPKMKSSVANFDPHALKNESLKDLFASICCVRSFGVIDRMNSTLDLSLAPSICFGIVAPERTEKSSDGFLADMSLLTGIYCSSWKPLGILSSKALLT